jgi:hypothetical protein
MIINNNNFILPNNAHISKSKTSGTGIDFRPSKKRSLILFSFLLQSETSFIIDIVMVHRTVSNFETSTKSTVKCKHHAEISTLILTNKEHLLVQKEEDCAVSSWSELFNVWLHVLSTHCSACRQVAVRTTCRPPGTSAPGDPPRGNPVRSCMTHGPQRGVQWET